MISVSVASRMNWVVFSEGMCASPFHLLLPLTFTFPDDFFTRMGPSVPEILRGDVSPKWDHLCSRYLEMIFFHADGTICAQDI